MISSKRLSKAFERLFDEFIVEVGLSEKYLEYLEGLKRRFEHQKNYIETGNSIERVHAEIEDKELQGFMAEKIDSDINLLCADIGKEQGYRINPKTTSVVEFYSTLNALKKRIGNVQQN